MHGYFKRKRIFRTISKTRQCPMDHLRKFFLKRIFITGHTGFKGSWLTSILLHFGSKVTGFSMKDEKNVLMKNSLIIKKLIIFMETY